MLNMSKSLTRALILLKHLGKLPKGAGVRELGRLGGFNPSTVHALLKSLQAEGFVDYDEASRRREVLPILRAAAERITRVLGSES